MNLEFVPHELSVEAKISYEDSEMSSTTALYQTRKLGRVEFDVGCGALLAWAPPPHESQVDRLIHCAAWKPPPRVALQVSQHTSGAFPPTTLQKISLVANESPLLRT